MLIAAAIPHSVGSHGPPPERTFVSSTYERRFPAAHTGAVLQLHVACQRLRSFGRGPARLSRWHLYRAASLANTAHYGDDDISLLLIFWLAGLAFSLFGIERFPSLVAAIAACP